MPAERAEVCDVNPGCLSALGPQREGTRRAGACCVYRGVWFRSVESSEWELKTASQLRELIWKEAITHDGFSE
jgi:hypothetical protein